jgi:NitT/TauT family transport system substrate-binding protein
VKDFEGNTVGILTGSETETIYNLLVKKNNLDRDKITEVEAPYDIKSFITTHNYDVRPAFMYDEPVTLDAKNIAYNIIKPEDYGVQMMGAVYFTTREMIDKQPEKVQAFVSTLAKGWEDALADPEYAIELLKKYDKDIDAGRELASLKRGSEYFAGQNGKILYVDDEAWITLRNDLKLLNKIDASFDVKKSYDNSFVNKYHNEK